MTATSIAAGIPPKANQRLGSIDAYRGLVMFLMLAEVLDLCGRAKLWPGNAVWAFLCHHQTHVEWVGCTLHDLIQPSFSFLVGTALVFSLAKREQSGQSPARLTAHALWRALVLVFLGIFLRSLHSDRTNFTFEDTLTQIGLGYPFLFWLGLRPARDQWIALGLILIGYAAAFALYPLPPADFDYESVRVSPGWLEDHGLSGFAAHWQKNSNAAWAFDRWFMNLFPRNEAFIANGGGYSTLSFIPTLGTMVLGLIAGGWLRADTISGWRKVGMMMVAGAAGLMLGQSLGTLGICPVVKRIWTPSWVLFSGGWCFLLLAGFYAIVDVMGARGWSFPLQVIGRNSIAAYLMHWLWEGFVEENLTRHLAPLLAWLGSLPPARAANAYFTRQFGAELWERGWQTTVALANGFAVLLVFWLILFWMDRKKWYLKI